MTTIALANQKGGVGQLRLIGQRLLENLKG
jgi:hypothetical protein